MADTAQILINLYDGTRNPLSGDIEWMARITDGRIPVSQRESPVFPGLKGSSKLFQVRFFDNMFDNYTVNVTPTGYQQAGWVPVRVNPSAPAAIDLMTLPKDASPHFANATWKQLKATRSQIADIIERGCDPGTAEIAYGAVLENRPKALACFLNIVTALSLIQLPDSKPLEYYWNIAWPRGDVGSAGWLAQLDEIFKQDRFFCYVEATIVDEVKKAVKTGSFAPEPNPASLHPDATDSFKQTQFDVSNVQLTFHGHDTAVLPGTNGEAKQCVKVEPDIDYYSDLGAHGLLEVIPNTLSGGLTDPGVAYMLRWMAGRRIGQVFNPLYTMEG